jgi:hypothetical protein
MPTSYATYAGAHADAAELAAYHPLLHLLYVPHTLRMPTSSAAYAYLIPHTLRMPTSYATYAGAHADAAELAAYHPLLHLLHVPQR